MDDRGNGRSGGPGFWSEGARGKGLLVEQGDQDAGPASAGELAINFQSHEVTVRGEPVKLTPVEYKLLYHLVRNAGRIMPHPALLDRVWGEDYGATTDYLKVFISRLRSKIEREDGPRYIETERGLGYRFVRPKETDLRARA